MIGFEDCVFFKPDSAHNHLFLLVGAEEWNWVGLHVLRLGQIRNACSFCSKSSSRISSGEAYLVVAQLFPKNDDKRSQSVSPIKDYFLLNSFRFLWTVPQLPFVCCVMEDITAIFDSVVWAIRLSRLCRAVSANFTAWQHFAWNEVARE